jgi:hypothetical protein
MLCKDYFLLIKRCFFFYLKINKRKQNLISNRKYRVFSIDNINLIKNLFFFYFLKKLQKSVLSMYNFLILYLWSVFSGLSIQDFYCVYVFFGKDLVSLFSKSFIILNQTKFLLNF